MEGLLSTGPTPSSLSSFLFLSLWTFKIFSFYLTFHFFSCFCSISKCFFVVIAFLFVWFSFI